MKYPDEFVNKIICGDFLSIAKDIPDKSIDMVFTSPPFKDEDVDGDYWELYSSWMDEIFRITSKVAIIINSANRLNRIVPQWPPKRIIIWGKGVVCYSWRWNPIFLYQISDEYKINKYIYSDAFGVQSVKGNWKVHKYQDPDILYDAIIKMFKGCDLVLDSFIGSGTTARVCKKLGKDFIGIELNPEYVKLAEERING